MRKLQISTILLDGILLAPFQAASAQEVAYANESGAGLRHFLQQRPRSFVERCGRDDPDGRSRC